MITEIAILHVTRDSSAAFEASFAKASAIIASMNGYIAHELLKCAEQINQYALIVRWQTLEDHTIGFRQSKEYQDWKSLLHHYYHPFPVVEHYHTIIENSTSNHQYNYRIANNITAL